MEKDFKITIGLEIHAELKTNSKMFCSCKNDQEEKMPNVNICPVCLALPGTLPVINKEAVKKVLLLGKAIGGEIADFTEFDRKNYFYPDIPKGYQISQYKYPLVKGGKVDGVKITRVHLEEDTAKSSHDTDDYSLVDFNRAGIPLMELVTEPVIHSKEQVGGFGRELQLLLQYLNISDANMEKGQMRLEVNISISDNPDKFGTKVEVKNINSFKAAERAVEYEFDRQKKLILKGEKIIQETRGFDEDKGVTFSQRSKENSDDYRYFPDPDLPKLFISKIEEFQDIKVGETPEQKRNRFLSFGIKNEDIEVYINQKQLSDFFEKSMDFLDKKDSIRILSNYITSDLAGIIKEDNFILQNIDPKLFSKIINMIDGGQLSSRGAKEVLKVLIEKNVDPEIIAKEKDLIQKNDPNLLKEVILKILNDKKSVVDDYKNGKESVIQFLIGQSMKALKGSGNPEMIKNIIIDLIK